jgi:hypothetical protein
MVDHSHFGFGSLPPTVSEPPPPLIFKIVGEDLQLLHLLYRND